MSITKKSISEVGHARNAANFNALINILEAMGTAYAPTNPEIAIIKLRALQSGLDTANVNLSAAYPPYRDAVAAREITFQPLNKLATRVRNSYNAVQPDPIHRENLMALIRKFRGDSVKKTASSETQSAESISNAQLSYDNRTATLLDIASLLATHPEYNPTENELKHTTLLSLHDTLKTLTNHTSVTGAALITARKQRNDIMYNSTPNITAMVRLIKSYLRSVNGAEDYLSAIVMLQFKAPGK